jgi:formimidoylglutamate deiminase
LFGQGGEIAAGARADLVAIDTDHFSLVGRMGTQSIDSYVFVAGQNAVRDVMVSGTWVVTDRRHAGEADAARAWRSAVNAIMHA